MAIVSANPSARAYYTVNTGTSSDPQYKTRYFGQFIINPTLADTFASDATFMSKLNNLFDAIQNVTSETLIERHIIYRTQLEEE